jgi:hypothetical protein
MRPSVTFFSSPRSLVRLSQPVHLKAQFNKKSSDRTKKAETEHLQQLEAKRIELQGRLNAKTTSLQDKLDALKREYDGQAEESGQLLKKIKSGVEKNLVSHQIYFPSRSFHSNPLLSEPGLRCWDNRTCRSLPEGICQATPVVLFFNGIFA